MSSKISLSVILPAYDEEGNISQTLNRCLDYLSQSEHIANFQIIVVEDGSRDQTSETLKQFKTDPRVQIVTHSKNLGYGAALTSGCRKAKFPWLLMMDADGQFDIRSLNEFLLWTDDYD